MKKALVVLCGLLMAAGAYAQGTVNFNNRVTGATPPLDAPVFQGAIGGARLDGAQYMAQLYAGPSAGALAPIGAAVPFRSGTGAGYWNPAPDATRIIPTVAPGADAFIKVVAWDTTGGFTTYEAFLAAGGKGESSVFSVKTGGVGAPPSLPAALVGLTSFAVTPIPEPTVIALGVIGGLALLLRRRK